MVLCSIFSIFCRIHANTHTHTGACTCGRSSLASHPRPPRESSLSGVSEPEPRLYRALKKSQARLPQQGLPLTTLRSWLITSQQTSQEQLGDGKTTEYDMMYHLEITFTYPLICFPSLCFVKSSDCCLNASCQFVEDTFWTLHVIKFRQQNHFSYSC